MSERPIVLVTNDDGIESAFLRTLVAALEESFTVWVSAPAVEQSWVGRCVSRSRPVTAHAYSNLGTRAWAVEGTPTDAVNLALGQLLDGQMPDLVVSGINMGFNASLPLILSSGTVAGAIEGALWGIPSMALSLQLPPHKFEEVKSTKGRVGGDVGRDLAVASRHAARLALELVHHSIGLRQMPLVHNVNFPPNVSPRALVEDTVPALVQLRGLYAPVEDAENTYRFSFPAERKVVHSPDNSDLSCLARGHISRTRLDLPHMAATHW